MASTKTQKAPKGEDKEPGRKPSGEKKPPPKKSDRVASANDKKAHTPKSEPELEEELKAFCAAVDEVGGRKRGMLSADHVKIYRCALRKLRG